MADPHGEGGAAGGGTEVEGFRAHLEATAKMDALEQEVRRLRWENEELKHEKVRRGSLARCGLPRARAAQLAVQSPSEERPARRFKTASCTYAR